MPIRGATSVMSGSTVKAVAVVPVPLGFVTVMGPVWAPAGTTTRGEVGVTSGGVAVTEPGNVTALLSDRFVPPTTIVVPTGPFAGCSDTGWGRSASSTISSVALMPVPSVVITLMRPLTVVAG